MGILADGYESLRRKAAQRPSDGMVEIRVDVDPEKLKAATQDERQEFITALFCAASKATTEYGADVDFSDAHHWIITMPEQHESKVRALLSP